MTSFDPNISHSHFAFLCCLFNYASGVQRLLTCKRQHPPNFIEEVVRKLPPSVVKLQIFTTALTFKAQPTTSLALFSPVF